MAGCPLGGVERPRRMVRFARLIHRRVRTFERTFGLRRQECMPWPPHSVVWHRQGPLCHLVACRATTPSGDHPPASEGKSSREIRRCVKQAIARHLFKLSERYDRAGVEVVKVM